MEASSTIKGVRKAIKAFDDDLKFHFWHLDELVDGPSHLPDISLSYCFSEIEFGYRRILYVGLVRKHRLDPELSWKAVADHDITRKDFPDLYKAIFSHEFPKSIALSLKPAEAVRDRMIHGKDPSTKELWGAVLRCIEYANAVNEHLKKSEGFSGYGKHCGITSRRGSPTLDQAVTALALKGVGLLTKSAP